MENKSDQSETETLKKSVDALLEKKVSFDIDILKPTDDQVKKKELTRSFSISPMTLGTMYRVSRELLSLEMPATDKNEIMTMSLSLIAEHSERMALIVALAVNNSRQDPPEELINFFIDNLTARELQKIIGIVIAQIDTVNFLTSIISARGLNILSKMNPTDEGSTLAPGKQ